MKLLIIILFLFSDLFSSTIGIATGDATIDGRPLLFKNKDATSGYPAIVDYYDGSDNDHYSYNMN